MENKELTEQEFYLAIGQRLRDLRKIANLTQQEVAEKAGIKQPALATFEKNGKRITSAHLIERIVKATGHTMTDLFSGELSEKKNGFYQLLNDPLPLVKEGTPNGTLYSSLKSALKIFLKAYKDGVAENIREETTLEQEIAQELEQAAAKQQATTYCTQPQ